MAAVFTRTLRSLEGDGPGAHIIAILAAAGLLIGWFAWFVFGRVAVYEVTQQAHLEVEIAAHPLVAQVGGRVVRTDLELGKLVAAGEALVELDAESPRLALDETRARLVELRARVQAFEREIQAEKDGLAAHRTTSAVAIDEAHAWVAEAEAHSRFAEQRVAVRRALRKKRQVSEEDFTQARTDADAKRAAQHALTLAAARLERERETEQIDRRVRIAKLEREAYELEGPAVLEATIRRIEHEISLHGIRAPIAGRVGQAGELRVGSVIRTGEILGYVVPPGKPRAVAFFPVADLGRIRPEQPARLRLDGFPWTQYGTLAATVEAIGNEPKDGHVRVQLALGLDAASAIPLEHGLSGTAEVEVERISPAQLVLRAVGKLLTTKNAVEPPAVAAGGMSVR